MSIKVHRTPDIDKMIDEGNYLDAIEEIKKLEDANERTRLLKRIDTSKTSYRNSESKSIYQERREKNETIIVLMVVIGLSALALRLLYLLVGLF